MLNSFTSNAVAQLHNCTRYVELVAFNSCLSIIENVNDSLIVCIIICTTLCTMDGKWNILRQSHSHTRRPSEIGNE